MYNDEKYFVYRSALSIMHNGMGLLGKVYNKSNRLNQFYWNYLTECKLVEISRHFRSNYIGSSRNKFFLLSSMCIYKQLESSSSLRKEQTKNVFVKNLLTQVWMVFFLSIFRKHRVSLAFLHLCFFFNSPRLAR